MAVYGDSLPNLRLIEYLSLVEMFDGVVHCKDLTEAFKILSQLRFYQWRMRLKCLY